jgi:hypothetical protein
MTIDRQGEGQYSRVMTIYDRQGEGQYSRVMTIDRERDSTAG